MDRAVFLDRDNTIIHNDADLGDPEAVRLIQGAASAIASFVGLGFRIVVISNQGGVARGHFGEADVEAVNRRVVELVYENSGGVIDRFYFCPYHPEGLIESYRREHPWRKPQPGMLLQAAADLELDLETSWTIGDQKRDVQAGQAAGTRTVLLRGKPSSETGAEAETPETEADLVAECLTEAARLIAQQPQVRRSGSAGHEEAPEAAESPQKDPEDPPSSSHDEAEHQGGGSERDQEADDPPDTEETLADPNADRGGSARASPGEGAETASVSGPEPGEEASSGSALEHASADSAAEGSNSAGMEAEAGTVQAAAAEPDRSVDGKAASQSREEEPMGNAGSSSNPSAKAAEAEWAPGHDQSAGVEPREPWSEGGEVVRGAEGRSSPDAAPGASAEEPARADPESRALLEQILRELRRDRAYREDFSLSRMLAAVMQMIAVGCVAFALLMAGSAASLLGWLLGAVLAQLSVIALLIIHGQR